MGKLTFVSWVAISVSAIITSTAQAQKLHWSKLLSKDERACLNELLKTSDMADEGTEQFQKLITAARIGRVDLNGDRQKEYVYLFDDIGWCGSAGCALLIGEREADGACRLLFNGSGWYSARALRRRDHGYYRLYLPCEIRFDGKQYQRLRDECPNVNVTH